MTNALVQNHGFLDEKSYPLEIIDAPAFSPPPSPQITPAGQDPSPAPSELYSMTPQSEMYSGNKTYHSPTISATHILYPSPPPSPPPTPDLPPEALVDLALVRLRDAGIELIEWRATVYRRMNVPVIVKDFSFALPDDSLDTASSVLESMGLPRTIPSTLITKTLGELATQAIWHSLSPEPRSIVLYPLSFLCIPPGDLLPSTWHTHEDWTGVRVAEGQDEMKPIPIRVPHPRAVYAAVVRMIVDYPRARTALQADLGMLIMYHLFGFSLQDSGQLDSEEDEEQEAGERRAVVSLIRDWKRVSKADDQWIWDALIDIATGKQRIETIGRRLAGAKRSAIIQSC
ncbi:hypothetical protein BC834DRAFT_970902 [Gloeopeniophorella convolvens]|nr:hypothetical protein BC834DRAFT_970902 [Gloeopeniophorella convolvens]